MQKRSRADDEVAVAQSLERLLAWLRDSRDPIDISMSAISALSRLDKSGSLRVTELSLHEGLTQPGMTTLIHRLEGAGFAVREPDPSDGRAVRVSITPKGRERIAAHRAARASRIGARLEQLSQEDQDALIAALPAFENFVHEPERASTELQN